jgi:dipeptidyl aminopeptidase/acylaminoacyl peptidase
VAARPPQLRLPGRRDDRRGPHPRRRPWPRAHRCGGGAAQPLPAGYTSITGPHLRCHRESVAFAGATPAVGAAIVSLHVPSGAGATVAAGAPSGDASSASVGVPISVPARDGSAVHGFWYEPPAPGVGRDGRDGRDGRVGRDRRGGGAAVRPPLILHLHGGPTDSARLAFDPELALWTSRGFALLDLDYSGSSGHGSAYRHRLDGAWGRRDLDDCVDAVRHLSAERLVDPARVFARGASAGGYLTLRCVTAASEFTGGMCRCGIADLALWRAHTHDFESRYTDLLVGPASDAGLYRRRSPAAGVGERAAPLLLVHGFADTVVPPEQALLIARSYAAAGRSCALELLPDEPHGLRRAASRRRWLTAELAFVAACAPEAGSP